MTDLKAIREEIEKAYISLEENGLVIGNLGKVTVCLEDGNVVEYPSGSDGLLCEKGEYAIRFHSDYVLALSCLNEDLPCITNQMASVLGGTISYSRKNGIKAQLLKNNGACCYGETLEEAILCCKVLEKAAKVYLTLSSFGNAYELSDEQIQKLK